MKLDNDDIKDNINDDINIWYNDDIDDINSGIHRGNGDGEISPHPKGKKLKIKGGIKKGKGKEGKWRKKEGKN